MSESESEDEILDRIEAALRKIAGVPAAPRAAEGDALDRDALTGKLDGIIARRRDGLGAPVRAVPESVTAPLVEDALLPEDVAPPEIWPEGGE